MTRETEALGALVAIHAGKAAKDLESGTLDFSEQLGSRDDTISGLVRAAVCFANSVGGVVVIGVANSPGGPSAFKGTNLVRDFVQKRVYELTSPHLLVDVRDEMHFGSRLLLVFVTQSPELHSDLQGRAHRRLGTDCLPLSPTDQRLLAEDRSGLDWSASVGEGTVRDVAPVAIASAKQQLATFTDERRRLATLSNADLLRALGLLSPEGRLLKAGEVLVGDYRGEPDPKIVYQYKTTEGGEPSAVERLYGPLLVAYQRVLELVQARRKITALTLPDGQQIQIEDFPELAVREAIANAVIHRAYHTTSPVTVEHSPSVLVVTSPGPLVSGVTTDNILTHPSKPRHPRLAAAAQKLGLAEEVGRGIDRMYREMIRSGRNVPRIDALHDRVRVSFVGGAPNTNIARYVAQLPAAEREDTDTLMIVLRMCTKATTDADELAPLLQKTVDEAEIVLRRLTTDDVGMLEATRESVRWRRPNYRLRGEALKVLGPAVSYRRRTTDEIDRKVITHVREYGTITNRTIQNLLDVNMNRAKQILGDLVTREVLVKVSEHERGPGVEYGRGSRFPAAKRARATSQMELLAPVRRARK